ncbi:hypothetical protein V6N13_001294 [Hibiscus sabdariffa]
MLGGLKEGFLRAPFQSCALGFLSSFSIHMCLDPYFHANTKNFSSLTLLNFVLTKYPKDSEKIMLAKQTGLTRNQVANWFIFPPVRLWKPMIEEFGEMDLNFKS